MKKLLLIRHAKASHDTGYKDFERPLKSSGLQDAATMAGRLKGVALIPQLLVSSPALRTITTAEIFSECLSLPKPQKIKEIYDAGTHTLLKIIENLPDHYNFIGLVGHNPAISDVICYLTGKTTEMHPGAVVMITFDIDSWKMADEVTGELTWYSTPKHDI